MSENTKTKPRICKVLGVEVGQPARVVDAAARYATEEFIISEEGGAVWADSRLPITCCEFILHAINHPETLVRVWRYTDDEMTLFRLLHKVGAKWASRDRDDASDESAEADKVYFWEHEPQMQEGGYFDEKSAIDLLDVPTALLPSIRPGQLVNIEEVLTHEKV